MSDTVIEHLILDLLRWLEAGERSYTEVMDAWRTSCPRLTVWEDANDRGLVATENAGGRSMVRITPSGLALLRQHQRPQEIRRDHRRDRSPEIGAWTGISGCEDGTH